MKKIILLMALFMVTFASQADTVCKLSNSETIQVKDYTVTNGDDDNYNVDVTLINDSNVSANITVSVNAEYLGFHRGTFTETDIVPPGTSTITVKVLKEAKFNSTNALSFVRVKAVDISGYKCQQ